MQEMLFLSDKAVFKPPKAIRYSFCHLVRSPPGCSANSTSIRLTRQWMSCLFLLIVNNDFATGVAYPSASPNLGALALSRSTALRGTLSSALWMAAVHQSPYL